jgi:hypothetical protein
MLVIAQLEFAVSRLLAAQSGSAIVNGCQMFGN